MTCRDCKHLAVPTKNGQRIRARKGTKFACTVEIAPPFVPKSMTVPAWPWPRVMMAAEEGDGCPTFEPEETN